MPRLRQEIIMAWIIGTNAKGRLPALLAAGIMFTATIGLGSVTASARDDHRDRGHREYHRGGWGGGYYGAPPVVYGTPYYAPPVVYGPGLGINLNIR
jgi:hypothetical protein